ncbi:hypothetical protein QYF61_009230 [Mycteria americana]|uniref:Uncharacterized protein n=1 Tax=Mycteria americana TaxID=33587 RepID=A0AAN7MWY8_MYCAM|nr:hypothetical protein QYF61_009230 [Mycteria americana]
MASDREDGQRVCHARQLPGTHPAAFYQQHSTRACPVISGRGKPLLPSVQMEETPAPTVPPHPPSRRRRGADAARPDGQERPALPCSTKAPSPAFADALAAPATLLPGFEPVLAARVASQPPPLAKEVPGRASLWQRGLPAPPACIGWAGPQPCSEGAGRCWVLWIQLPLAEAVEASPKLRLVCRGQVALSGWSRVLETSLWGTQAQRRQGQRRQRWILCRYDGGIVEPGAFKAFGVHETSTGLYIRGATRRGIRDLQKCQRLKAELNVASRSREAILPLHSTPAGQGCLVLSDRAVTCGPACAPTAALAPASPAARHRQRCLRRELLPAEKVQRKEAD